MYLIFDTETTGLPQNWKAPLTDFDNWPRMVQIAWQMHDEKGALIDVKNFIIKPEGYDIPYNAEQIHGISTERAQKQGVDLKTVLEEFTTDVKNSKFVVGHNIEFDNNIVGCELLRSEMNNLLSDFPLLDTMKGSVEYCQIPGGRGGGFKWPSLTQLHEKLFGVDFDEAHNASADVEATARCFLELVRLKVIPHIKAGLTDDQHKSFQKINPKPFELIGLNIEPYISTETKDNISNIVGNKEIILDKENVSESPFVHLHTHSQYSILQATADVKSLVDRAVEQNMPAIGLTDHTNMFGAFKFIDAVLKHPVNAEIKEGQEPALKAILGCELNVCKDHLDKSMKDYGSQVPFLCKNKEGYHNLAKLSSVGFIDGFYYVPRVDKELIKKYGEKFGLAVFEKKVHKGMSLAMVEDAIGKHKYKEGNDYYFGKPFKRKIVIVKDEVIEDKPFKDGIWIDMPKKMLTASWGRAGEKKETVTKSSIKQRLFFNGRKNRQGGKSFEYQVDVENDLVVGWKELE